MNPFECVREFHVTYGLPIADSPGHPSADRVKLRRDLISEEYWEYDRAVEKEDLIGVADALGDLFYVIVGAALEYGIPLEDVITEIHRSNLTKLDTDGGVIRRIDGKVLKGPLYEEPQIAKILGVEEQTL